ncbi:MAG: endonuclease/exonuclease/phosphatase family protein [Candidatus Cloacimonetes bacterium]|nr:endonuclease/exonuclease/phosphatase family protein [Candidatus Cloacimonadota bacterium]
MKYLPFLFCIFIIMFNLHADGPGEILPLIKYENLRFGSGETLEIVTWNIQNFPKSEYTVEYVSRIMQAVDADIYALQEIENNSAFFQLLQHLNTPPDTTDWRGFRANSDEWDQNLAYVYKTAAVKVEAIYEIFNQPNDEYAFPRFPLIMECLYQGNEIIVINNHFKARAGKENEIRRKEASERLKKYIDSTLPDKNVIMLGDLNDHLTDTPETNVFQVYLDDRENYLFTDYSIAADSTADWSYPYWEYRGHIDHILVSNELFDEFNSKSSEIRTIVIDRYMEGGEENRYRYITDHRPIGLKLKFTDK